MILSNTSTSDAATADADLVLRTRSGDRAAFGELWSRHYLAGTSVARSITSSIDPDDLVQESYTRIYQAILKGGGPNGSFRAYLFTSIRNTAAAWGRSRRETPIDELDVIIDPSTTADAADEAIDHDLTAEAFRSLPARWQEVLWYTEIEQMKPATVAPLLGMKAGAVSQLAFRAREGLREAWILAHLRQAGEDSECRWTIEHLGAHSRGNLSSRDSKRLERHIDECASCVIVAAEAKDVSDRLALVLLPLVLGVAGASGYIATLQSTPAVIAAAPIPTGVFDSGAAVGAATGASPLIATDGGATGGLGGTASGGSGSSGGAITGIGALVGTGSAALVVAGVVAAAAVVPGLVDASPATSLPSASDLRDSSISSEVEPDPDAEPDEKFLLEIEQDEPDSPTPDDSTPEIKRADRAPADPPATVSPPATTPNTSAPSDDSDGEGGSEIKPTEPPVEPEPTDPPETPEPDPEPTEPPTDPEPTLPAGTPTWETATQTCLSGNLIPVTHYTVPLTGAPNATVQVDVDGVGNDSSYTASLNDAGAGTVILKPTGDQIVAGILTKVTFRYVLGDLQGEAQTTSLYKIYNGPSCLTATASGDTETSATDETSAPAE